MAFFDDECLAMVKTAIPYLLSERGRSACQKALINGDEDLRKVLEAARGIDWGGMLTGAPDGEAGKTHINDAIGNGQTVR